MLAALPDGRAPCCHLPVANMSPRPRPPRTLKLQLLLPLPTASCLSLIPVGLSKYSEEKVPTGSHLGGDKARNLYLGYHPGPFLQCGEKGILGKQIYPPSTPQQGMLRSPSTCRMTIEGPAWLEGRFTSPIPSHTPPRPPPTPPGLETLPVKT